MRVSGQNRRNRRKQQHKSANGPQKHPWLTRLRRLLHYRLMIPVRRGRQSPAVVARGAAVGVFVGLTPTVGLQIILVTAFWGIARFCRWPFSLIPAIAWTWLSNPANMVPLYFLYYKTGTLLMGMAGWEHGTSEVMFHGLEQKLAEVDSLSNSVQLLLDVLHTAGIGMIIGCLPYAIALSSLSYWVFLFLAKQYQRLRQERWDNSPFNIKGQEGD